MHRLEHPFAKAIAPLAAGVVFVGINWIATGDFDAAEARLSLASLATGVLVYWVPNARRP